MSNNIRAPHRGIKTRKNRRFRILKAQPTHPQSGRCKRIEPGARSRMAPVTAEATRIMSPKM